MRRPLSPTQWTVLLSVTLAGIAALLTTTAPELPLLTVRLPAPVLIAAVATVFMLAEQFAMSVEFRRQTHSTTLAGVPLLLGVFLLSPIAFVLARVVGSLIAFERQRLSAQKILYNISAYAFEAALGATLLHLLFGTNYEPTGRTSLVVVAILAAVDQLMCLFVLVLIRLHNGPLSRGDVVEVLAPALVLSIVASTFAFASLILIKEGPFGVWLAVVLAAVGVLGYREHASTRRRHQSLALVHELVTGGVGAESIDALATQLLSRIRQLLRAATAELLLLDDHSVERGGTPATPATQALVLTVDEDDQLSVTHRDVDRSDWALVRTLTQHEPMLATRDTKDHGLRRWLSDRGLRDAMLVALPESSGLGGALTITDRLGETSTFTADDLTLLQTLTGHLAVAVRSTRLLEKLGYDATHDSLTGLANRSQLYDRIAAVLSKPAPHAAVLLLDLDRFKEVNDALGHDVGDRLLVAVADRLRHFLPPSATIARLGGDEFAILIPNLVNGVDDVVALAEGTAAELAQPVAFDEAMLTPEASIGVAVTTPACPQIDLLRQADTAMYEAKANDVRVVAYRAEMDRGRVERLALLADLRASLTLHPEQFDLQYQPKIDLHSGEVTSVEALVRWHHPTLGVIAPDRFIPIAESAGLIAALTPFILIAALRECRQWMKQHPDITVAVNLSAREISDTALPARVAQALATTGVPADHLILEITESSVMGDPEQTMPVLQRLNQLGVCLSLDDFGTGYSSLSYLQRLPVNEIKIDRSFILGLSTHDRANSRALIRSIAGLGTNLGLRIVAEGIEDADTLDELRELGCQVGQGYYVSRPLPASHLTAWLADNHTQAWPLPQLVTVTGSGNDAVGLDPVNLHRVRADRAPLSSAEPKPRLSLLAQRSAPVEPFEERAPAVAADPGPGVSEAVDRGPRSLRFP